MTFSAVFDVTGRTSHNNPRQSSIGTFTARYGQALPKNAVISKKVIERSAGAENLLSFASCEDRKLTEPDNVLIGDGTFEYSGTRRAISTVKCLE